MKKKWQIGALIVGVDKLFFFFFFLIPGNGRGNVQNIARAPKSESGEKQFQEIKAGVKRCS